MDLVVQLGINLDGDAFLFATGHFSFVPFLKF
jgi:hypothetical protein